MVLIRLVSNEGAKMVGGEEEEVGWKFRSGVKDENAMKARNHQ